MNQGIQGEGGAAAVRIEDLLAEAGWIRSLARSLVRDGQAADDVVQETWMAVLRKPPLADRPLRPWLARVVTNFARMQQRGEASRRRREASVARAEELPSSAEMVERVEIHKVLAEAVVTLEEPLRETVMLRYFAGLSSVEIARRTGTPAGTVRWRLKRGLEELRTGLDRRHAGRDGWLPAAVALARSPLPQAAGAGLSSGAVVATLLLALAVGGAWLISRWVRSPDRGGPGATPALASAPAEKAPAPIESEVAASPSAPSAPRSAVGALRATGSSVQPFVALRAVDQQGRPLAGARLFGAGGRSARTDASGHARLELPPGAHTLRLEAEGHVAREELVHVRAPDVAGIALGSLMLERSGSVAGRAVDAQGHGLAGAAIAVEEIGSRWMEAPHQPLEEARYLDGLLQRGAGPLALTRADAGGHFVVEGLAAGFVRIWASAPGRVAAYSAALGIAPGGTTHSEPLTLREPAAGELIRGRVVDRLGQGVPGARVEAARRSVDPLFFREEPFVSRAETDAEGRFAVLVDPGARYDLAAAAADDSRALVETIAPGSEGLRLELAPRQTVRLRWTEGEVGDVSLKLLDARRGRRLPVELTGGDSSSLTLTVPQVSFSVQVEARGCAPLLLGPFEPRRVPAELAVSFEPLVGLAGCVSFGGEPLPGALVTVLEAAPEPLALSLPVRDGPPFEAFVRPRPFVHRATTDAAGCFRLPELPGGGHFLRVEAPEVPELAAKILAPSALAAGGRGAFLAIELDRGGVITGRAAPARDGRGRPVDPAGTVIGISAGDGRVRSTRVRADGTFRFEAVPVGSVQLRLLHAETAAAGWSRALAAAPLPEGGGASPGQGAGAWTALVPREGGAFIQLDLPRARSSRVLGRLTIDGRPAGPWQVRLQRRGPDGGASARDRAAAGVVGPDGSFDLEVYGGGAFDLELWNSGFEPVFCVVRDELELVAGGERRVNIDYSTGELVGTVGAPLCTDVHHVWYGDATLSVTTRLEGDEEGRCDVRVPSGPGAVLRRGAEVLAVDLDPGATLEFELQP